MVTRVGIDPATAPTTADVRADETTADVRAEATSADVRADVTTARATGYVPRDTRLTTILLIARMSTRGLDDLCCVRNISAGGMRIETLAHLEVGQDLDIEFKNGITVRTQVAWVGRGEAGLRSYIPIVIEQVLGHQSLARSTGLPTPRGPRLSAQCPVALRNNGRLLAGNLENISQGGAQVRLSVPAPITGAVVLIAAGLGAIHAIMRWQTRDVIGMAFVDPLAFADLSAWLASSQRFSADGGKGFTPSRQSS
jgi:hypothetical protein